MSDYKIFCDSSCDTPGELLEQYDIELVPFYVSFDQELYQKEIVELSIPDFYKQLTAKKVFPKTSLPSVQDYISHFTGALQQRRDILCICLTSVFSGSYQSAVTARSILLEEYPQARIEIVDSIQATACEGLTLLQAACMREAGFSLADTVKRLEEIKTTSRILFTVGTLEYLQKGGRIGKAASLAGSMLNLKPLLVLKEGELHPAGTIRGRSKSLSRILSMVEEHFAEHNLRYEDYEFTVATGTCFEEAGQVKASLEEMISRKIHYPLFTVGVTIGTNTGPDAIGICFIRKYDA